MKIISLFYLVLVLFLLLSCSGGGGDNKNSGEGQSSSERIRFDSFDSPMTLTKSLKSEKSQLSLTTRSILFTMVQENKRDFTQKDIDSNLDESDKYKVRGFKRPTLTGHDSGEVRHAHESLINETKQGNYEDLLKSANKKMDNIDWRPEVDGTAEKILDYAEKGSGAIVAAGCAASAFTAGISCGASIAIAGGVWAAQLGWKLYKNYSSKRKDQNRQLDEKINLSVRQIVLKKFGNLPPHVQDKMINVITQNPNMSNDDKKMKLRQIHEEHKVNQLSKKEQELYDSNVKWQKAENRRRDKELDEFINLAGTYKKELKKVADVATKNSEKIVKIGQLLTKDGVKIAEESMKKIGEIFKDGVNSLVDFTAMKSQDIKNTTSKISVNTNFMSQYKYARATLKEKLEFHEKENEHINRQLTRLEKEFPGFKDSLGLSKEELEKDPDLAKVISDPKFKKYNQLIGQADAIEKKEEKLNKLKEIDESIGSVNKKLGNIKDILNNIGEDLGIDPGVIKAANTAYKIGSAVETTWKAIENFGSDGMGSIESITGVIAMFGSNKPDPKAEMHKEVMEGLTRLQDNQIQINKDLKELDQKIANLHKEKMVEYGIIESDLNYLVKIQKMAFDETIGSCQTFFPTNSCEIDSNIGLVKEVVEGNKNCKFVDSGTTIKESSDLYNGRILSFATLSSRAKYFNENYHLLNKCLSELNSNLTNISKYKNLIFDISGEKDDETFDKLNDYRFECKRANEENNDPVLYEKCLHKIFVKQVYLSIHKYFFNHVTAFYGIEVKDKSNRQQNDQQVNLLLRSYFKPISRMGSQHERKAFFEELKYNVYDNIWSDYRTFFYSELKNKEKTPIPFNIDKIKGYIGYTMESIPWIEMSAINKEGNLSDGNKFNRAITDLNSLALHKTDHNDYSQLLEKGTHWLNLAIATELFIAGEPLLETIFQNIFYNYNFEGQEKFIAVNLDQDLINTSLRNDCFSDNRIADSYCVLSKSPLVRKNFVIYLLNKVYESNPNNLLLYKIGLNELGDSTFLDKSLAYKLNDKVFNLKLPFHFENNSSQDSIPLGWSVKFGNTYIPLPTPEDVVKGEMIYRNSLQELIVIRNQVKSTLTGIYSQIDNEDYFENTSLNLSSDNMLLPKEKKALYDQIFKL